MANGLRTHTRPSTREKLAVGWAILVLTINLFMTWRFLCIVAIYNALQSDQSIKLPVAAELPKIQPAEPDLEVFLHADHTLTSGRETITSLATFINARSPYRVIVRAERAVKFDDLKLVLKELGSLGVTDVTFAVVDPDPITRPVDDRQIVSQSAKAATKR